jgi:SAM-dependent methyltransferase
MDLQTSEYYSKNAEKLLEHYNSTLDGISKYFKQTFKAGAKVIDIGTGSGKDLKNLLIMGYTACGIDPCSEFVKLAIQRNLIFKNRLRKDSLPELKTIPDNIFDGIVCSSVLMHLDDEELLQSAVSIRRILKNEGKLLISIPVKNDDIDPITNRDKNGRFYNGLEPEFYIKLFKKNNFTLKDKFLDEDALGRKGKKWVTLHFVLDKNVDAATD